MSSPTVLTWHVAPLEEARQHNRLHCDDYIERARILYEPLLAYAELLRGAGEHIVIESPDEAHRAALAAFGENGKEAVEYAHAYWQRLKHKIEPEVLTRFVALQEKQRLQREAQERAREESRAAAKSSDQITGGFATRKSEARRFGRIVKSADQQESRLLSEIAKAAAELGDANASVTVERLAKESPKVRLAQLEMLCLSLGDRRAKRQRERALEEALATIRGDLGRTELRGRLDRLNDEALPIDGREELAAQRDKLASVLSGDEADIGLIEREVERLEQRSVDARFSRRVLETVEQALRRLGFERVEAMQTLTPEDIRRGGRRNYFAYADDPDAFLEIEYDSDSQRASIQPVWARRDESMDARNRKTKAQQSCCSAAGEIIDLLQRDEAAGRVEINERRNPGGDGVPVREFLVRARRETAQRRARTLK